MPKRQASLQVGREPLQIPVPPDFKGDRTSDAPEIFISSVPGIYSLAEIEVIQNFLPKLPYRQGLNLGALFIDADDPLISASHDELDQAEKEAKLPNTRRVPGGGERSPMERLLILREAQAKA